MSQVKDSVPEGWIETTLKKFAVIEMGQSPKGDTCNNNGIGKPLLNGPTEFGTTSPIPVQFTTDPKRISQIDDLLFCVRGSTTGKMNWSNMEYALGRGLAAIRHRHGPNYRKFIRGVFDYKLNSLLAEATGSTFPNISRSQLENIKLYLPPLQEQKAIANVLRAFDDKIENLRAQNDTLEQTAQTIFTEWFGKYQIGGLSADMASELPEGWRVGKLGEVTKICGGTTPSTKNPDFWGGTIYWTSPKDLSNSKEMFLLSTEKTITEKGLKKISSGLLPKKTLLLSSRAPIGYLSITDIELAINQGYIAILANQHLSNQYMYLWLKTFIKVVENAGNGSTFLEISKTAFRSIECVIPEKNILRDFDNLINPLFDKILSNIKQIQTLSQTRDTLLPKLMNGQLRVKGFDR